MFRYMILAAALALISAGAVLSQDAPTIRSPVLIIDRDLLYQGSAFGQRVARELEAKGTALSAENRRIEADLEAEEQALTERRKTIATTEFRALADAFDEKVTTIRRAQSAKTNALSKQLEEQQLVFLQAAGPVLETLMREAGAAVVLDRRDVFLSADAVDITATAIARIDASLGAGTPEPAAAD